LRAICLLAAVLTVAPARADEATYVEWTAFKADGHAVLIGVRQAKAYRIDHDHVPAPDEIVLDLAGGSEVAVMLPYGAERHGKLIAALDAAHLERIKQKQGSRVERILVVERGKQRIVLGLPLKQWREAVLRPIFEQLEPRVTVEAEHTR